LTSKKRGLGRGLSALIRDNPAAESILVEEEMDKKVINIPLDKIVTKADQPRKEFNEGSLRELAKSIEINGVIQPILVRSKADKYEIIAGERRYRASKLAKLKEIPAILLDADNEEAAKLALVENIQREDLNPIEEAMAYKQLIEEFNLKQEELANAIGKSRTYITNSLRLLNLDSKVVSYLYDGRLTPGHGKALLGLKDKKEQVKLAERIMDSGLNVRETEAEVKKLKDNSKASKAKSKKIRGNVRELEGVEKDPYIADLEDELMRALGTKVRLIKGNHVNKIVIEFYDEEDLERIYDIIVN